MTRRFRWPAAILLTAAALAAGLFLVDVPDQRPEPTPPDNRPRVAVALGDSTLSGEGAGDYEPGTDGTDGNWCHRSANAAIHQTRLPDIDRTVNLACSGAHSEQVGLGDHEQYGEPSQARRLGDLARRNRVVAVVVAVGANDDPRFARTLDACVQAWFDPGRPGCAEQVGPEWADRVDAMVPEVVGVLRDIRDVLREAGYQPADYALVLQSYAAPVGPSVREDLRNLNGCPIRTDDLRWVGTDGVTTLTAGLRRAAHEAGARFLDLSRAGRGHEACTSDNPDDEWFARLAVRWEDLRDEERAGHAMQESFHPNAAGHAQFGRCLGEFLATDAPAAACVHGEDGNLHPTIDNGP